jgi:hypothetical protein
LAASELDHWDVGITEERLGRVYIEQEHSDDGISLLISAVENLGTALGRNHPETLDAVQFLADAYHRVGRMSEAEATERDILTRREQFLQERDVLDEANVEFEWEEREHEHAA